MDSPISQINSYLQKLPRSSGKPDAILISRLVVAALLLAAASFLKLLPVFKTILLILSVLIAGYDIVLDLIESVMDRELFSASLVMVLIALLGFLLGSGREAALCVLLYRLGLLLIVVCSDKTRKTAQDLLAGELKDSASVVVAGENTGDTAVEKEISAAASLILKCLIALALLFAVLMPILTSLTVREAIRRALIVLAVSLPLSVKSSFSMPGLIALSFTTRFGTLFKNARTLEKLQKVRTAVIDKNGIFADNHPQFVGIKPEIIDEETFMEFVSHALYYSDQAFAKAILGTQDKEYRLELISDFKDIPGLGVDVKIGGAEVTLAKRELLSERGVSVPGEGNDDSSVYYLIIAGRYVGKILLSEQLKGQNKRLVPALKQAGIQKCILLTEDSREESERLGTSLKADEVFAEFTDETKLQYLESLDGQETVYLYSNSLEAHSNAAVDVRASKKGKYADALVIPTELELFPQAFRISRRMREISTENAIFAFGVKAILLFLGLTGNCTVWFALFLEVAAAIATVLNSIRVTKNPLFELPKL